MKLTLEKFRELTAHLDGNLVLADLRFGNSNFKPFNQVKRMLVLEEVRTGDKFLTINGQGSHFHGTGDQCGLKIREFIEEKSKDQVKS